MPFLRVENKQSVSQPQMQAFPQVFQYKLLKLRKESTQFVQLSISSRTDNHAEQ